MLSTSSRFFLPSKRVWAIISTQPPLLWFLTSSWWRRICPLFCVIKYTYTPSNKVSDVPCFYEHLLVINDNGSVYDWWFVYLFSMRLHLGIFLSFRIDPCTIQISFITTMLVVQGDLNVIILLHKFWDFLSLNLLVKRYMFLSVGGLLWVCTCSRCVSSSRHHVSPKHSPHVLLTLKSC